MEIGQILMDTENATWYQILFDFFFDFDFRGYN